MMYANGILDGLIVKMCKFEYEAASKIDICEKRNSQTFFI